MNIRPSNYRRWLRHCCTSCILRFLRSLYNAQVFKLLQLENLTGKLVTKVCSIHEKLGQICNNAFCFSFWPLIVFVFLTELIIVWPNRS